MKSQEWLAVMLGSSRAATQKRSYFESQELQECLGSACRGCLRSACSYIESMVTRAHLGNWLGKESWVKVCCVTIWWDVWPMHPHHNTELWAKGQMWKSWPWKNDLPIHSGLEIRQWFAVTQGFRGSSDGKESACNAGDPDSIPGLWRSPGEGNGNPLQYSCLENSVDRPWDCKKSDTTKQLTHTQPPKFLDAGHPLQPCEHPHLSDQDLETRFHWSQQLPSLLLTRPMYGKGCADLVSLAGTVSLD